MRGRLAAVQIAAVLLAAVAVAGCAGGQNSARARAGDCAAIAVQAARGQFRLAAVPEPCRGLGPAALGRTVKIGVGEVARHGTKSERRHLAIVAYRRLSVLTALASRKATADAAARARHRAAHPRVATPPARPGWRIPAGAAALAAWLLAAASGALLVLRRRRRPAHPQRPQRPLPPVLVAHLGFALAGLAVWAGYLLTGAVALAWTALGALLPVAGLGMATLILAIPDPMPGTPATADPAGGDAAPAPPSVPSGAPSPVPSGARLAAPPGTPPAVAAARIPATGFGSATTAAQASTSAGGSRPSRPPVVLIAVHGALATATILLALLAAVAAIASH